MTEIERLRQAIRDLHGLDGSYVRSVAVKETFRGETVWDGVVEVFAINGSDKAAYAYAWSYETDEGGRRYLAILGVPPILGPRDAVRAAIAAGYGRNGA